MELLHQLARRPRPAGSEAEADARRLCARELEKVGFVVTQRPVEYSAFPGRFGTPLVGAILLCLAVAVSLRARSAPGRPLQRPEVALVAVALLGIGLAAQWLALSGTVALPFMRRHGLNLEAVRVGSMAAAADPSDGPEPIVWLVAHMDSKSQPVPLLLRAAAAVASLLLWGGLLAVWALAGPGPDGWGQGWIGVEGLAWLAAGAAIPLALSWTGRDTRSGTGALDNASGVATVVRAAALMDREATVGVLLTTAEELGLAGARGWLAQRGSRDGSRDGRRGVVINCDGVDDRGAVTCTVARDGGVFRSAIRRLEEEVGRGTRSGAGAGGAIIGELRVRRSLPGVLLDAMAFAQAGWAAATVSRGTPSSLGRVHSGRDSLEQLRGDGIEATAVLVAELAGSIIAGLDAVAQPRGASGGWNKR